MLFSALPDCLDIVLLVKRFVISLLWSAIYYYVCNFQKLRQSSSNLDSCFFKVWNKLLCRRIKWKPISHGIMSLKGRASLDYPHNLHIILLCNCISNTFSNCPVSVNGYFDWHYSTSVNVLFLIEHLTREGIHSLLISYTVCSLLKWCFGV